MMGMKK